MLYRNYLSPSRVIRLFNGCPKNSSLRYSVITLQELRFGIDIAPIKRRNYLNKWYQTILEDESLAVLDFDSACASSTGTLLAQCKLKGRTIPILDAQIAGTALAFNAVLATRNEKNFKNLGIPLIDPFVFEL